MPNPATIQDLERIFFRSLTTREFEIATTWLDAAYRKIVRRRPTIDDDITAGAVTEADLVHVICTMVARVFSNPEGKNREAIDDYSYSRDDVVADGVLRVTPDELADLTPGRRARRSVRLVAYGE